MEGVPSVARRAWAFADDVRHEWVKDRVGGLAAEIAFFAVLAVFPAVIVLSSALGAADSLLGEDAAADMEQWVLDQVDRVFGEDNSLADTVADLFEGGYTGAFTLGLLLSVYAASRGFVAVVRALDVAYDHEHLRGWWSTRLIGLALTVLTLVVVAVVTALIVVGPLFGTGADLADDLGFSSGFATFWDWLRWPVVFVILVSWAATLYHVAPNHRSPWRHELPGSLLATVWWVVVSLGFSTYLAFASSGANAVFGLLGGALGLLLWLYLMAMGLLVGAEVNSLLAVRAGLDLTKAPPATPAVLARLRRRLPEGAEDA